MSETIAYIALGSNLGDREAIIASAFRMIDGIDGVRVNRTSTIIETEPAPGSERGPAGERQGMYLNAVVEVRTTLGPRELLDHCLEIERTHGRVRPRGDTHSAHRSSPTRRAESGEREALSVRWGPRTLDLDLLLYGDAVLDESMLTVPHPRMHERVFVLRPLAEIARDAMHPILGRTVECLLHELEGRRA